jgi:hypothetical protein
MYRQSLWSSMRFIRWAFAAALVITLASGQEPRAQQPPGLTVPSFLANPAQVLQQNPNGGPLMITQIRDLAVSDPATLSAILGLLANANNDQKTAIGSALGQAARIVVRTNQAYGAQIQAAVAQTNDRVAMVAFTAVTGERELGGIGGGAGASGGAVGGQTNALSGAPSSTGAPQQIGGPGTPTGPFGITSSVTGLGGGSTSTPLTTSVSQ